MLRIDDIKIGARVKCIYTGGSEFDNKLGTIISYTNGFNNLLIKFDGDRELISWYNLIELELVVSETKCKFCNKINDIDVSVCWNCAGVDPLNN